MLTHLRPAAVLLGLFTLLTGLAYPFLVTGAAQVLFPVQANGSLMHADGRVIGSSLVGQPFDDLRYFWGRPSATSVFPYNAAASTGSNLGPSNPALLDAIRTRIETLRAADPEHSSTPVPVDLVTSSASGLDPHISPAAALYQVSRVAKQRGLTEEQVHSLVTHLVEGRTLGVLGEPRVNVVILNRALDELTRNGA